MARAAAPASAGTPARRAVPKRFVVLVTALAALVMLAAGPRTWVRGRVTDAVLDRSVVAVTGGQAAPGVVAAALVAAAAMLAALTGGRLVRWIAAAALTASGILVAALMVPVVLDPDGIVGSRAASLTGRTGQVAAQGEITFWVIAMLVCAAALICCGLAALWSVPQWAGLTSRYEVDPGPAQSPADSDWDRLTRGEDPT